MEGVETVVTAALKDPRLASGHGSAMPRKSRVAPAGAVKVLAPPPEVWPLPIKNGCCRAGLSDGWSRVD